jgi:hypothetical protein
MSRPGQDRWIIRPGRRWVARCWPTIRQARRWETQNRNRSTSTARWRWSVVRSSLGQLLEHRLDQRRCCLSSAPDVRHDVNDHGTTWSASHEQPVSAVLIELECDEQQDRQADEGTDTGEEWVGELFVLTLGLGERGQQGHGCGHSVIGSCHAADALTPDRTASVAQRDWPGTTRGRLRHVRGPPSP